MLFNVFLTFILPLLLPIVDALPQHGNNDLIKRRTLSAVCKSGHTVETSLVNSTQQVLICCDKNHPVGGWGPLPISGLILGALGKGSPIDHIIGPICCRNTFNYDQCDGGNDANRQYPASVKECIIDGAKVPTTMMNGREVCVWKAGQALVPAADEQEKKREDFDDSSASADAHPLGPAFLVKRPAYNAICPGSNVPSSARIVAGHIDTICCPNDYPVGGWAMIGGPICCSADANMIECGEGLVDSVDPVDVAECVGDGNVKVENHGVGICEAKG